MGEHRASQRTEARGQLTSRRNSVSRLEGAVDVCIDRPLLSLDRPFTYRLPEDALPAGVGSLVKVPFHGKKVRGWITGPGDPSESVRILDVHQVVTETRFFDEEMLALYRWAAQRFVTPLSILIDRGTPKRIVSEEGREEESIEAASVARDEGPGVLGGYAGGDQLLASLSAGDPGAACVQPAPEEESILPLDAIDACMESGRTAIVLVPEADPIPETAEVILDRYGGSAAAFMGGSDRARYRLWLDIMAGRYRCVVGTRPAVFAPVPDLGLIWIQRESHPGHRETRSPAIHARDIALHRARSAGAVVVLAGRCVSLEAASLGLPEITPRARSWPPVEVVQPASEGRAPRLISALRSARSAFLFEPRRGYGVAVVCRSCKTPASCANCGGYFRVEDGDITCAVCEAPARCATCGQTDFGIRKGGRERVEEWVAAIGGVSKVVAGGPQPDAVAVGSAADVRDIGSPALDVVGILDADMLLTRTGLAAQERALSTWTEAAGWARPNGRVIVQTRFPNAPVIQSLVAGSPRRFHRAEREDRAAAGFPVGAPVFRVVINQEGLGQIRALGPITLLEGAKTEGDKGVCLVALRPETLVGFGTLMRTLARSGEVARVDAEPHM